MKMKWMDRMVGPALALAALAVYGLTLSRGAAPGTSAQLLTAHLGLTPRLSPASPLWSLLARGVAALQGPGAVQALNLMSALFAAGSLALLYSLMRRGVLFFTDEYQVTEGRRRVASIVAGVVAVLCLAFSIPFWAVANRAHTAAFDVFLLLLLARLFVQYTERGQLTVALGFVFLYGVGLAQSATLIVFGPVFALALLYVMWKRETLRAGALVALVTASVLGLLMYGVAAWDFYGTPGYALRGYRHFGQILWFMWRDQVFLISRSLPREGWLVILIMTVVPWAAMFAVARRALNGDREWGVYILHAIMTALAVAIVLNVRLAPWPLLGWRRLLVTPYLLVAMVSGYLAAYWFLMPDTRGDADWRSPVNLLRLLLGRGMALALLGLMLWAPLRNAAQADAGEARVVNALADVVVESLDGRSWLVTDGMLDAHLLLAARRQAVPLRVLNMMAGSSSLYLEYIASFFEDVRLKNLASLSLPALLRVWLSPAYAPGQEVAVLAYPELWVRHGFTPLPHQLVFFGTAEVDATQAMALMKRHQQFWPAFEDWLHQAEALESGGPWVDWARGRAGMVANDLGVLLEDQGQSEAAYQAYQTARRLDTGNVSALLNMVAMVDAGRAQDPEGRVQAGLEALEAGLEQRYHIWSLSRHYGTVRAPEAFAQMGWTWAFSGRPGMAISQFERATALMPDAQQVAVQGLMADLYLRDQRHLESEAIYKDLLLREPGNLAALQGMMRLALIRNDAEQAAAYLQQSIKAGLSETQAEFQQALVDTLAGRYEEARERLEVLLIEARQLTRGWVLLAEIGFATGEERLIDQAIRRLETIEGPRGLHGSMIRGRRAFEVQDLLDAAGFFEVALSHRPGNRQLIETLLRLDLVLGRADSIRRHVQALLEEDPGHALALYVRGSLQIANGDLVLAEDSLRRSLERDRLPMALNDLAWLLQARGEVEEAEALVNEALAINEEQPPVWSTKGEILLKTGRAEEAEAAFGRSIALSGNNPSVHLQMGQAQLALGKTEAVRRMVRMLEPHVEMLSGEDRETFNHLREAVQ